MPPGTAEAAAEDSRLSVGRASTRIASWPFAPVRASPAPRRVTRHSTRPGPEGRTARRHMGVVTILGRPAGDVRVAKESGLPVAEFHRRHGSTVSAPGADGRRGARPYLTRREDHGVRSPGASAVSIRGHWEGVVVTLSYPPGPATGRPAVPRLMRCRRAETRGHPHGIKGGRGALFGARDTAQSWYLRHGRPGHPRRAYGLLRRRDHAAGHAAPQAGAHPRRRAPADHGRRHLRAKRRQPSRVELPGDPRLGQAGAARRAVPRSVGRVDEVAVLRRRGEGAARQPGGKDAGLGPLPRRAPGGGARAHPRVHRARPGCQADRDHRRLHLPGRPEHHAGGARPRDRQLRHHHPQVPGRAGEGAARYSGGRRDGRADPAGVSAREGSGARRAGPWAKWPSPTAGARPSSRSGDDGRRPFERTYRIPWNIGSRCSRAMASVPR